MKDAEGLKRRDLGVFAEFETNLRRERQLVGIAVAKAKGKHMGRKAILSDNKNRKSGLPRGYDSHGIVQTVWSIQGHHLQRDKGGLSIDLRDIKETKDLPAINQFRQLLDVMEQFLRDSQHEQLENEQSG